MSDERKSVMYDDIDHIALQGDLPVYDSASDSWIPTSLSLLAGTSGTSGVSYYGVTSGTAGSSGTGGVSGTSGTSLSYRGTSFSNINLSALPIPGQITITTSTGLGYSPAQHIIAANSSIDYVSGDVVQYDPSTGALTIEVVSIVGTIDTNYWITNLDGVNAGGDGSSGSSGSSGTTGTSGLDGTIGTSGTSGGGTSGTSGEGTSGTSGDSVTEVLVSGPQNLSNKVFTLATTISLTEVHLFYLNGQLLTYNEDYTISGTTLTISSTRPAPAPDDKLRLFASIFVGALMGSSGTSGITISFGGTINYVAKFIDTAGNIGDTVVPIYDDGTNISIGNTTPNQRLTVAGGDINLYDTSSSTQGKIRIGNSTVLHSYGTNNIFLGKSTGNFTMSGVQNVAAGYLSFNANTTGYENTALGNESLHGNTTGRYNVAIGSQALYANTTGYDNYALGHQAMLYNTIGVDNAAMGTQALFSTYGVGSTTGSLNVAIGAFSMDGNTEGRHNTAIGAYSGQWATTVPDTFTITNPGLGYIDGTYYNVALTPLSTPSIYDAHNPRVDITVTGGIVTDVIFATGGRRTTTGNTYTVSNASVGGSGAGFICSVATVLTARFNTLLGAQSYWGTDNNAFVGSYNTFIGYGINAGNNTGIALAQPTIQENNTIIGARVTGLDRLLSNNIILADGEGNQRLNIDDSGNVYIGGSGGYPTFAGYKLDVTGSTNFNLNTSNFIRIDGGYNPAFIQAAYSNFLVHSNVYYDGAAWLYAKDGYGAGFQFETEVDGGIAFYTYPYGLEGAAATAISVVNIDNTGNVGMGTNTPAYKLDVNGSIGISNTNNINFSHVALGGSTTGFGLDYLTLQATDADTGIAFSALCNGDPTGYGYSFQFKANHIENNLLFVGDNTTQAHYIHTDSNSAGAGWPLIFGVSPASTSWSTSSNLLVLTADQRIGIGTTTPATQLHLKSPLGGNVGADTINNVIRISSSGSGTAYETNYRIAFGHDPFSASAISAAIGFVRTSSTSNNDTAITFATYKGQAAIPQSSTGDQSVERMRIDPAGNVGIGTTTPARKLHVSDVMRLEPRGSAPGTPAEGDIYYDSTLHKLRVYDGSGWQNCW